MSKGTPPWLSIITVCYNDSKNLSRTLGSIRDQTFDSIQSIVIDGNSTDNTLSVINDNNDVISDWISEKDNGLYDAMNKGLTLVKGEYILFLNAGDIFHNDQVVAVANHLAAGADVLYGDAIITHQDGSYKSPYHKKTPKQLTYNSFQNGMVVCHQSLLMKYSIAETYDIQYKIAADIDWAIRSLKKAKTIRYLGITICDFQTGGLSSKQKKLALIERWKILVSNFGISSAIWSHCKIIYDYILRK